MTFGSVKIVRWVKPRFERLTFSQGDKMFQQSLLAVNPLALPLLCNGRFYDGIDKRRNHVHVRFNLVFPELRKRPFRA